MGGVRDKPTFATIPMELRNKIYSYMLLEKNVAFFKWEGTLRFKYDIGLFTVSKDISYESLKYFYSQNFFIAIEVNLGSEFFHSVLDYIIPNACYQEHESIQQLRSENQG